MAALSYHLNHRMSVQQKQVGTDDQGGASTDWVEVRKAWTGKVSPNGMQAIKAGAVTSTVNVSLRLRACTDIVSGMRLVEGGTVHSVLAVLPAQDARYIDLVCQVIT